MRSRQIAERLGVEEAHMLEFHQFNMVWDKRMADYEHHAEDMVFAMRVRETDVFSPKSEKMGTGVGAASSYSGAPGTYLYATLNSWWYNFPLR